MKYILVLLLMFVCNSNANNIQKYDNIENELQNMLNKPSDVDNIRMIIELHGCNSQLSKRVIEWVLENAHNMSDEKFIKLLDVIGVCNAPSSQKANNKPVTLPYLSTHGLGNGSGSGDLASYN